MKKKDYNVLELIGGTLMVVGIAISFRPAYAGTNEIMQFISAAAPWVLTGSGLACILSGAAKKKG